MFNIKYKLNNFLVLILLSFLIYFLWLFKLLNDFPWRYVFTDWIINYKGGYIRRGLLGEISSNISIIFNLNIKYVFLLIHLLIYSSFHIFFFKFFHEFKRNYLFYMLCFSPLVFLYPITTFEAFARKEIFCITFFLINCYISLKSNNRNLIFFINNLFVIISYLIHEFSIFFINFFYLSYFIFLKKNNLKIKFLEILIIILIYIILFFLLMIPVSDEKIITMVNFINERFFTITDSSGAISWLQRSASSSFLFLVVNKISLGNVLQNLLFLHFYVIFFFLLYSNKFFKIDKSLLILTVIVFFSPLSLFIVGNDWGRFVYIIYNFCLIFTFYSLHGNKNILIDFDKKSKLFTINNNIKTIAVLLYVSAWSPKLFFYDKFDFLPLVFLISNLFKYTVKYTNIIF